VVAPLILLLTALTSTGAYVIATQWQSLPAGALHQAVGRMLDTLGAALMFFLVNVALGVALILGWRALTGVFVSIYQINDLTLLILSLVQGLVYQWWQEAGVAAARGRGVGGPAT
jgi:hypothetical protein